MKQAEAGDPIVVAPSFQIRGTTMVLTNDQVEAVRLAVSNEPIVAIQAAFGTGQSTKAASKSHFNTGEANACVRLIELLLRKRIQPDQICVISFYKEQSLHLQTRLDQLGVELTTVDSVQGREKETRQCGNHTIRHGQFILGNAESLTTVPFWRRILDWAARSTPLFPHQPTSGISSGAESASRSNERRLATTTPSSVDSPHLLIRYPSPCSFSKGEALHTKS
ncbi:hypothetical protein V3C99_001975 [Haemonchus contortus]